ncbi:MAG TPA: protein-glutamate O-methyltransferase CheR [Jatrophihabitans sp.]|nr:protein-glutamate O-methyltransferase CheR [Jatrophihabitans sp.]
MTITETAFDWVREVVRCDAAIVLEPGKEYLVESRLAPLARAAGRAEVSSFIDQVRVSADRRARARIVDALTTNETSWFRDGGPFTAFERELLPQLVARRGAQRSLRIWSAACSTGQEPYSLAMILRETLATQGWDCRVLASDLSPTVLDQARQGAYNQVEMNRGLPASRLVRHFSRDGMRWRVNDEVRELVSFRELNLARPFPPLGQFDVVFLRNVLIYFSVETRREILQRVRATCRPDGYLVLGGAETTLGVDERWQRIAVGTSTVYQPA